MVSVYCFPTGYPPNWHIGARMGVGPVRRCLRRLRARGATTFLDVGTGPGSNCLLAAQLDFDVYAADLSAASLRLMGDTARRMTLSNTIHAFIADGLCLPFGVGVFDVVFASHVIEHLDEPRLLLDELDRVLKPGGTLRLACPTPFHGMRILKRLGFELDPDDHKVLGYSESDIAAMLPASMRIARTTYQGRFFESNGCDLQYLIARRMQMRANPVGDGDTAPAFMPDGPLHLALRECALLPWLAACTVEDTVLPFVKGSMLSMEIEKAP